MDDRKLCGKAFMSPIREHKTCTCDTLRKLTLSDRTPALQWIQEE